MADKDGVESPNYSHREGDETHEQTLRRIRTAGSLSISPELFERLYLTPQNAVKGDLRRIFGNPTPLALIGFLICLTPLSADLMGWRGAGGNGAAGIGTYYFFGGLLMIIGSVFELILGNTFPSVVFGTYGAFWLSLAATLTPYYNAAGAYAGGDQAQGFTEPAFNASFGFFLLFMALVSFMFMIAGTRTNIALFGIFFTLVFVFTLLVGAYWQAAMGSAELAGKLQKVSGGFAFVTSLLGWWIFFSQILASVDFPFELPLGDLSGMLKGAADRKKTRQEQNGV